MGKIKITDIRERTRYVSPDKSIKTLQVSYETETGYRGVVMDIPVTATEEEIWAVVEKAAKVPSQLIGAEKEVE